MLLFGGGSSSKIDSTDSLEIGYSNAGMKELNTSLEQLLYEEICNSLDTLQEEIENTLDMCWQGKSHDNYVKDFEQRIEDIKEEIKKEYQDLEGRLADVAKFYGQQDDALYTRVS